MERKSALSSEVRQYLENINGASGFFERFLSSEDFADMKRFAKDFGGITIVLPQTSATLLLNVFGQISYHSPSGEDVFITSATPSASSDAYQKNCKAFLSAVRKGEYQHRDSAWCAEAVIQALYDSVTEKVRAAITQSRRT
jgi:hypothetical protein